MLSLPVATASPLTSPSIMLGILAGLLLTGAIMIAIERRAEARDRKRPH